jgi:hypothetical protein
MLTANHVSLSEGYVSFDGTTTYQIADNSTFQIVSGADVVDLKLFQITDNPATIGVNLFPEDMKGLDFGVATHIGWGVGYDDTGTSNPWTWGESDTVEKRWGLNEFEGATRINYPSGGLDYDFESLYTASDSDVSVNEAAATLYDSGSGLFVRGPANEWFLAGTIAVVSNNGSSTFAADDTADLNYAVRIAEYSDEITALMAVPEPAVFSFLIGLFAMTAACGRRV